MNSSAGNLIVGLTGGIGSGKSTAAEMFAELGADVIDTDAIAHRLTAAGQTAVTAIAALFGQGVMAGDATLDRAKLRQLIFSDAVARNKLEDFLHPLIREQVLATLAQSSSSPYRIVVVPLLFETQAYQHIIQRSLLIDCPEQLQLTRTLARSTLSEQEVRAIMAAQWTRQQRLTAAADIIVNDGNDEELKQQVKNFHKKYLSLA